jgi:hypothetical protein
VVAGIRATSIKRLTKTNIATSAEPGIGAQKYDASEASRGNEQSSCHAFFMS